MRKFMRKFICNLGDVNPLWYGGEFIYREDERDSIEILELSQRDEKGKRTYIIYTFDIDKLYKLVIDNVPYLLLYDYKKEEDFEKKSNEFKKLAEWFSDKIEDVCYLLGANKEEFYHNICSEDVRLRANSYMMLVKYFGAYTFDNYPVILSIEQIKERYSQNELNVQ